MRAQKIPQCLAVVCCLTWFAPIEARSERAMSRVKLEKELKHLRESLHEAHRELGIKADRIAELEAALNERLVKTRNVSADEPTMAKVPRGKGQKGSLQESHDDSCGEPKELRAAGSLAEAEVIEQIFYDQNSAVNYEGREKVLRFVQRELRKAPETRFSVVALANDSEFQETDKDIALNRARFLADYLKIKGVPEQVFSEVKGESSDKPGRNGRVSRVTATRDSDS